MIRLASMQPNDKLFIIASVILPLITWWVLIGHKRYSVKGMK